MKLVHAPDFSIRRVVESSSETVPISEVIIAGAATGKLLEGAVFEAALRWNDYVLIFLTNDVPFEDSLNIYLLDRHLNVVDYALMYAAYSTGIFSRLDLSEANTARFHFLGESTWTLRLFSRKQFFLPILGSPLGVHRPFTFFHCFQISTQPCAKQVRTENQPASASS
ncbi:hypothetical protein [Duganella qianjiadongensis]|uniref:Uncharacterized protein n=1 Tax=Duganella qianjiadongensis TaxID=2692176 RepID=A0ABW9VRL2_9BURK|nr:hypothetical protein [Duganella qianjiadongensis]MYM41079.1 hypothetical protein [Duganella qianjiadongensis]